MIDATKTLKKCLDELRRVANHQGLPEGLSPTALPTTKTFVFLRVAQLLQNSGFLELSGDLEEFQELGEDAMATIIAQILWAFSDKYSNRFKQVGVTEDLDMAIRLLQAGIDLNGGENSELIKRLGSLGSLYLRRYESNNNAEDIHDAVNANERAIQLADDESTHKPALLNNLGNAHLLMFHYYGQFDNLDQAAVATECAVALSHDGHPNKPAYLNNLGNIYWHRFEKLEKIEDLHLVLDYRQQAVAMTSEESPLLPGRLYTLASAYHELFTRLDQLNYLREAITTAELAVALAPISHPERAKWLTGLGTKYKTLFTNTGHMDDIYKSLEYAENANALTSEDHVDKPAQLCDIGSAWGLVYEHSGQSEHLQSSLGYLERAVALTPHGHLERSTRLANLGTSYGLLFERLGEIHFLQQSITCQEQALSLTPDDHASMSSRLISLSNAYQRSFRHYGRLESIYKSIGLQEKAIALTSKDSQKSTLLNNLGGAYLALFEHQEQAEHIQRCIECLEQATSLTQSDHPDLRIRYGNLGTAYSLLYQRRGGRAHIEHAVELLEKATAVTPQSNVDLPSLLSDLGGAYGLLFGCTQQSEHLHKAIDYLHQSIISTPHDYPGISTRLNNLGLSYLSLFEQSGQLEHLEAAIENSERAVAATPENHPDKPSWLHGLGSSYLALFRHSNEPSNGLKAAHRYKRAALAAIGPPSIRFLAARKWATVSFIIGSPDLEAYMRAMDLLTQVAWLGTSVKHRYECLADIRDVVTESVAAAIELGRLDLAIQWFEQGRAVVWSQILQLRTPFDELYAANPALAEELKEVSLKLERASINGVSRKIDNQTSDYLTIDAAREHSQLAEKWEQTLGRARELPGLANFLRPATATDILEFVKGQVLFVVNVDKRRCDALVLADGPNKIIHVPLADLSSRAVDLARDQLLTCLNSSGFQRGFKAVRKDSALVFQDILAMLWNDIAKPILHGLGWSETVPLSEDLPHITWCTSGALAFLPLHSSGDYSSPGVSLYDLAISSYTPTLSLVRNQSQLPVKFHGMVAVGHESSIRGLSALSGTRTELDQIENHMGSLQFLRLEEENATARGVLEALANNSWVHFACHGSQNHHDPMKSALHLHDKDLDLATISGTTLKNARLAFLSACQTATEDLDLPEESVHLAAGLLTSGFKTVIATMWSIHDKDAPLVAGKFYEYMLRGGKPDSRRAAIALHQSVKYLRDSVGVKEFTRWVPYIHIGH
ncbi:CHAT domain protein [Ceratobasidium sp. AG-Ba]|nr:CHAT domain protein [Ceratobasidium sp. AG-Ba]